MTQRKLRSGAWFARQDKMGFYYRSAGGPLAFVQNGNLVTLDVAQRRLQLEIDDPELARRRTAWTAPPSHGERGYVKLYVDHLLQANAGVDLDFLAGRSGSAVPRDNH